ncbi:unnamed protein product [Phytophthora lilii]|uniref:Unnamed protein product n=1 Tax=Phytophthora lilii TaxID=2077276 RepID=A0A9W7CHV4_9STRA|nr:unnamed protein product [Phytophthora lilii]
MAEETEVKLRCGVYGEGTVFPVKIARDAEVSALQEKIAGILSTEQHTIPPRMLTLYLAQKNGETTWLADDDNLDALLQGDVDKQYMKMRSSWILDEDCFGKNFQPGRKEIHVLVELPQLSEAELPRDRQLVVGDVHIPITQSMSLNPPALVAFWEAFLNDRTEVKADALVELPQDTYLLGDSTLGSRIYIRHCYPELWKVCWKMIHDEAMNTPHLVILGNPGIGKTFFSYVILLHLAHAGATVVYESGKKKQRLLFSRDMVVRGSNADFIDVLEQPKTYYIVDALRPENFAAKTILLTSPRRSIWWEFNKTNCDSLYMPVWTWKEIMNCRESLYQNLDVSMVSNHFRRWGGIARYVLEKARSRRQQRHLAKALDSVDLDLLANACGKEDAHDEKVSHRLLHYRVNSDFDSDYFEFASEYVQQEVYKRLYEKDKRKLLEFIAASDGVGALAVLRGHLFEGHVHSVLPRGGTFRVRQLVNHNDENDDDDELTEGEWGDEGEDDDDDMDVDDDAAMEGSIAVTWNIGDAVEEVELPEQPTVVFNNGEEVQDASTNIYLRPSMKNYKSVDAIIKPDILLQVTGAHKHPCKQKGLHDVLKLLGNPAAPQLFFVLPPDRSTDFKYQRYMDSKRKRMTTSSYVNVRKIQQFAMEVKLASD